MASSAPPCCQSCGNDVAHVWDRYWDLIRRDVPERVAMDQVGVQPWRYCCRATLFTWVPTEESTEQRVPPAGSKFRFRTADMVQEQTVRLMERELRCV